MHVNIFLRRDVEWKELVQRQHQQHNVRNLLENRELNNWDVYYRYLNERTESIIGGIWAESNLNRFECNSD